MQWTERERTRATLHTAASVDLENQSMNPLRLISIQFSAIFEIFPFRILKWIFCCFVSNFSRIGARGDIKVFSDFSFFLHQVEQKVEHSKMSNLLPQDFPEAAEAASIRNFSRVGDRHDGGL